MVETGHWFYFYLSPDTLLVVFCKSDFTLQSISSIQAQESSKLSCMATIYTNNQHKICLFKDQLATKLNIPYSWFPWVLMLKTSPAHAAMNSYNSNHAHLLMSSQLIGSQPRTAFAPTKKVYILFYVNITCKQIHVKHIP